MPDPARFLSVKDRILPGVKRTISPPNPAPGTEWSVAVPGGQQWRPLAAIATLTTSAAVASRVAGVRLSDGNAVFYGAGSINGTAAGQVNVLSYAAASSPTASTPNISFAVLQWPLMWLPAGYTFGSFTQGIQAADTYSGVVVMIEQAYLDDDDITVRVREVEDAEYAAMRAAQPPGVPGLTRG